jgi:hypothetical protein
MTSNWTAPSAHVAQAPHGRAQIVTLRIGKDQPSEVRGLMGQSLLVKIMAALRLLRGTAVEAPPRPLARLRARHAALGFPYRRNPIPAPTKPDRDCDCVPWSGL